jgi:hypothetical protein
MQTKILGFTGTQKEMTEQQKLTVKMLFEKEGKGTILHHGDCVGADAEAHQIAAPLGYRIVKHPCDIDSKRANCWCYEGVWTAKAPIERNHDIVDCCHLLIATPKGFDEEQRSGTWATIRYAVRVRKEVIVVWPDGRYETIVTLPLHVNREVKSKTEPYFSLKGATTGRYSSTSSVKEQDKF